MPPIYLDYNATTPTDPAVVKELALYLSRVFGNPSSSHPYGKKARDAVEIARARLAALLGCDPAEVVFTSGGTESNNQALIGAAFANKDRGNHIISTAIEHPAILKPLQWLARRHGSTGQLPSPLTAPAGINPDTVLRAVTGRTILISVITPTTKWGRFSPWPKSGEIAREKGIIFHTDAAQSVGKVPTRVNDLMVDLLTVAGHKFFAPKGVGALFVRRGTKIDSYMHGAGQEGGRRAGTENVAYIAALGKAAELAARRVLPLRAPGSCLYGNISTEDCRNSWMEWS